MLIAQMQTLETHPDFTLSISNGIGSYRRTAELRSGAWQGHDLTHHFDDNRSNLPYGELASHSHNAQQDSLQPDLQQTLPATVPSPRDHRRRLINVTRLNTTIHKPTTSHTTIDANIRISIRLYKCSASIRQRPSSHAPFNFQGEGVEEAHTSAKNIENAAENKTTSQSQSTVVMRNPLDVPIMREVVGCQDSYDALLPSTPADPQHLIGFQANPELQEQQKKQEKAERQVAKAPIDLRDVLNQKEQKKIEQLVQKKRASELASTNTASSSSNLSRPTAGT